MAPLSVIIMGTDGVSRANLRRHMPRTFKYLKEDLEAADLQGYIKVADNTDPNLTAVLMGLTNDERFKKCNQTKQVDKYDDCPLIWKDFSKKGYITAYAEDAAWMGLFHYNKIGHVKEPTDYYNRPYFVVSEDQIGHKAGLTENAGNICQGDKKSISVVHDYSLDVANTLKDIPYFGFYWSTSLTHDWLERASIADEPSLKYLMEMKAKGLRVDFFFLCLIHIRIGLSG